MCFTLAWLENLLIYIIIVCAVIAILRLLLPFVLGQLGVGGGIIIAAINIVVWAFVAIMVVWICFDLISCLGGLHMPRLG